MQRDRGYFKNSYAVQPRRQFVEQSGRRSMVNHEIRHFQQRFIAKQIRVLLFSLFSMWLHNNCYWVHWLYREFGTQSVLLVPAPLTLGHPPKLGSGHCCRSSSRPNLL